MSLPVTMQARYIGLTARMMVNGANLGEPHTHNNVFTLRNAVMNSTLTFMAPCCAALASDKSQNL